MSENRKMLFRIGINLGDVIQEGDKIFGDDVNLAARIQKLSAPGGICIARNVYDQVKNKLAFGFEYIGEHTVKNITGPVRVYRVLLDPESAGLQVATHPKKAPNTWLRAAAAAMLVLGIVLGWRLYHKEPEPEFEKAIALDPDFLHAKADTGINQKYEENIYTQFLNCFFRSAAFSKSSFEWRK